MQRADVVIVGLGAMGSAAACQLARRGVRVVGVDRHHPPHPHGSTTGESRVTRVATAEGAAYVPLAARSHELWRRIEAETGTDLFTACGVVMVGPAAGARGMHGVADWVGQTIALAERFDVVHEVFDGAEATRRFPALHVEDEFRAYYEPGAGFVRPEAAVAAQLELAQRAGAELRLGEEVTGLRSSGEGVEVTTATGRHLAQHAIVSVGAWLPNFLAAPELRAHFTVQRQALHWFDVDPALAGEAEPGACPVYFWATADTPFYGFPAVDGAKGGMKVASEDESATTTADTADRDTPTAEALAMYDDCRLGERLPALRRAPLRSTTCLYTVTPDSGFVIDAHPEHEHVTLVSPCSGHGFKHSAAIGEALAQRIVDGRSATDLDAFGLARLS